MLAIGKIEMNTLVIVLWVLVGGCSAAATLTVDGACATVELEAITPPATLLILSNGRPVAVCAAGVRRCSATLRMGARELVAYALYADGALVRVASVLADATAALGRACALATKAATVSTPLSVGMLYSGWHAPPATALANITARGGMALSVEDVLRSAGNLTLHDVYGGYPSAEALAAGFYYQARPRDGYYCIYRKRTGEGGVVPDCPGIPATLARHAAELSGAGVDFVTVDGTNLGTFGPFSDEIQLRPGEVVFEEWAALRRRGVATPAIAAWQTVPTGSDMYTRWLALYNNVTYAPLVHRDARTGKKIFFVPPNGDAAIIAAVESNGGRNDVVVQQMWALNSLEAAGQWSFFAPCIDGGTYTTSVVGKGRGATGCGQRTSNALGPLARVAGSQIAVSPSYQMGYGSIAFEGANKYDGLTFKRQFATVLDSARADWAAGRAATLPAHIVLSSYNEWTAQPQKNPFPSPWTHSLGLAKDAMGAMLWVDSYGQSVSRDIEASADEGSGIFEIMASCLRVIQLASALDVHLASGAVSYRAFGGSEGLSACSVAGEVCCAYNDTTDGYAPVWALRLPPAVDALLTNDATEVAALVKAGWVEQCNPYIGPTDFCVSAAAAGLSAAQHGPLVLHMGGCELPRRAPLHRCYDKAVARHFVSLDDACEGATVEGLLGCVATDPTSNMARVLRVCTVKVGGMRYHVLDGPCEAADTDGGVMGYAR